MMREDGSYESTNFPIVGNLSTPAQPGIYKGMVIRTYPIDDNGNISQGAGNQEVMYDLIILGGPKHGQQVTNVRDVCFLGGLGNYSERIWRAASNPNFQRDAGLDIAQQDGDVVLFFFLGDNPLYPMIIGGATHYQNNGLTGAKLTEMPRLLWEYNGIHVLIDNQGQLFVTHKGGKANTEKAAFTANSGFESVIQMSEQQVIIKDSGGNTILIDAPSKSITITAPNTFTVNTTHMRLLAQNDYVLTTQVATVNATTSHTMNTPTSTVNASISETLNTPTATDNTTNSTINASNSMNVNTPTTNINIGHAEGTVNVNGNGFDVVTTNSYDPFLMGPHIDGYPRFKTKG